LPLRLRRNPPANR